MLASEVETAIERLPKRFRHALLFYLYGEETAVIDNSTIRVDLYRGRKLLRKVLA